MIVLDTNVLVAGLRSSQGCSRRILQATLEQNLKVGASPALFLEYEAVLTREENLAACRLNRTEMIEFLDALAGILMPVDLNFLWRPQLRDPADEMVLETAVNGQAETLVTWNTRDFLPAANKFELRVMRPDDFWTAFHAGLERSNR